VFKYFWRWKRKPKNGSLKTNKESIDLLKQIANENPLWGVPRIHGEMKKLGYDISPSTI
jgi:hypothetical protein